MTEAAALEPSHEQLGVRIGIAEADRKALSDGLAQVLADSYTLLGKTHGFHWNVVGAQFPGLHEMFEVQYRDLQKAVDKIAERIRALGFLAPGGLDQFLAMTTIANEESAPSAQGMVRQLVNDNQTVTRACRAVVEICHQVDDTVTEDLMNKRMNAHEKAAWMLRASLEP